jgi:hypothetical protein
MIGGTSATEVTMPTFKKVDAEVMKRPVKRASRGRPISPEQEALVRRIKTISDDSVVYEAKLSGDEKPATVRQQLLRAAKIAGVEIAVKRSPDGFYFGLMTDDRRSNRGRKPGTAAARSKAAS